MLDVLYRSRECLDHPGTYHMEFLTYVLQNIATKKTDVFWKKHK